MRHPFVHIPGKIGSSPEELQALIKVLLTWACSSLVNNSRDLFSFELMILPSSAGGASWLTIWKTWRGIQTIKEANGRKWKGRAPGQRYHANTREATAYGRWVKRCPER